MTARWGLGPVFAFEWLRTTRRWQLYASRSLFVGLLLIGLAGVWWSQVVKERTLSIAAMAAVGESCFQAIVVIQFVLVMLAGPAATAGAICLDKARGAMAHLLITDLSDAEIVLGKLAARLVPVVGLIACALPVTALGTLVGGIDPVALTGAFAATLAVAVFGCALAMTFSVWGKKTHEVLLATYTVWLILIFAGQAWATIWWLLGGLWSVPEWLDRISPLIMVLGPAFNGRYTLTDQLLFALEALGASALLTVIAVARVRPVTVRQFGQSEGRRRSFRFPGRGRVLGWSWDWLPGPSLDDNPVLWRDWRRNRPSGWVRIIWSLYVLSAVGFSVLCIGGALTGDRSSRDFAAVFNGFQVTIGLLLLSVSASTSLTEERARGSLDVLMVTPMSTWAIVSGKWLGAFRTVPLLAILPFWVSFALAIHTWHFIGPFLIATLTLAYGAALTSLGLALATWVRQPGRATALCVSAYVLVTIGSVFLSMLFFPHEQPHGFGFAMACPFFGTGYFSAMIGGTAGPDRDFPEIVIWAVLWQTLYSLAALQLFLATLGSFNRCLGRVTVLRLPLPRSPKPKPEPDWLVLAE